MMTKLRHGWQSMQSSFWFVPILMVVDTVVLAIFLITLETSLDLQLAGRWPLLFDAGAAGARGLLTTVASSMITVAGLVFSITLVALSLTSSQYTSRVIRNFMRDRVNQLVLGVFLGIFAYCLVVLRTIRGGDEGVFIPTLAVLVGLMLAFVGIAVLIHFIRRRSIAGHRPDTGKPPALLLRLLGALHTIAGVTTSPPRRRMLRQKVDEVAEAAERSIASPHDLERLANRLARVREAFGAGPVSFVRTNQD